jgi:hypothetical protein
MEETFERAGTKWELPERGPGKIWQLPEGESVRVMEPSAGQGYRAIFYNKGKQPVDPFTGKPPQPGKPKPPGWKQIARSLTHFPMKL